MSKALNIADAMAARLNALLTLPAGMTLVDRQKDIRAEVAAKVAKAGGAAAVILYEGFSNSSPASSSQLRITRRYTVTIYSKPVLRDATEISADDIVETIARSLHDWEPEESADGIGEISVTGCDLRPDAKFLIYDLDIEILSRL